MDQRRIQTETQQILEDVLDKASLQEGALFVLGLSSSEVLGGHIGKDSSQEIGELIVKTMLELLAAKGIHLAVQGCEHVNRALVVEREVAIKHQLECTPDLTCRRFWSVGRLSLYEGSRGGRIYQGRCWSRHW